MKQNRRWIIPILILFALSIYINLPNHPGIHLGNYDKDIKTQLGLDLVGGVQALLEADLPADVEVSVENMQTARRIIEDRVNGLGVSEAVVQLAGDRRILVELPGQQDPEQALSTIKETALLEFVNFGDLSSQEVSQLIHTNITTDYKNSSDENESISSNPDEPIFHTVMTGASIKQVGVTKNALGRYLVVFELTPEGSLIFREYTTNNTGKILAIVLDNEVISAPRIEEPIISGRGSISGDFSYESANNLSIQLKYGSLPVPLIVVQTETIGPTLGQDSLDKSLVAGIIGLAVVMLFMALYYRLPGIIADLALILYILVTFALYRWIPVTLTLPGIAGFVLSIGVAVDANVLIFERMKEELRAGHSIQKAISLGWDRAWPSIRDSNLSTLITSAILYWFGSSFGASIVKGFSLTLAIGVLVSLFTAVTATRTFLHLLLDKINVSKHLKLFGL
ncbi:MAG: protein translocase subunit SecD [Chloroflexota bacterium]|nr:MAG: protein translocase subunit SecD [Chloroflexota bacterium]HDD61234.1 protein translocase subunit SecD [Chloroflexota bacterium]